MAWILDSPRHTTYNKNFVKVIVGQLRFHPILSIERGIGDYQEAIRGELPGFRQETVKEIRPSPLGIDILETPRFIFTSTDQNQILSLAKDYIALESRSHRSREYFLPLLISAYTKMYHLFGPVRLTRLGLRYVNIVDKSVIESERECSIPWERIVSREYLALPSTLSPAETSFSSEITSTINGGMMTLRHGLGRQPGHEHDVFTYDIDRYSECGLPDTLESLQESLQAYADDIFGLFTTCIGDDLRQWMTS